jgi:hypothetical protein
LFDLVEKFCDSFHRFVVDEFLYLVFYGEVFDYACDFVAQYHRAHGFILLSDEVFGGVMSVQVPLIVVKHFELPHPYWMNFVSWPIASLNLSHASFLCAVAMLPAASKIAKKRTAQTIAPMAMSRAVSLIVLRLVRAKREGVRCLSWLE